MSLAKHRLNLRPRLTFGMGNICLFMAIPELACPFLDLFKVAAPRGSRRLECHAFGIQSLRNCDRGVTMSLLCRGFAAHHAAIFDGLCALLLSLSIWLNFWAFRGARRYRDG